MQWLKKWMELPETIGLDQDDPTTIDLHLSILERKRFLRRIYAEWYCLLKSITEQIPEGIHVELGSGAGFLDKFVLQVVKSEVTWTRNVSLVCSAEALPFRDSSVSAIYLVDVLHHIRRPRWFFSEASRCLKPGGKIVMIEPYNTWWGRWLYRHVHHEAFDPSAGWELEGPGRLSEANAATPWIIFGRDRPVFDHEFPELHILEIEPFMPVSYLLSGGMTMRSLLPGSCYGLCRAGERLLGPLNRAVGMFALIHIEYRANSNRVQTL